MSNTVLVTGGAGFIGSHVAEKLVALGNNVIVLDDLSSGFVTNIHDGATFVNGSITDVATVDALFEQHRFDVVYHLAAYAAEGLSHFIRRFNYTNNVMGSINLINASIRHEVGCFVFTSSIAVYGDNNLPMHEGLCPNPTDPYGIAKYTIEKDLAAAHEMFGLNYVIFRPHNVYGERQNIGDRYRNVIGIFMNQILRGEPLTIFGDGSQTRGFSYIGDIVTPLLQAPHTPAAFGEVFNLGSDDFISVSELARIVASAMSKPDADIRHVEQRNEVQHAYASHEKARRVFDLPADSTPIGEGVQRMADWAMAHGAMRSQQFENIEITRNLPSVWRQ